jgi:hypothetical protein
MIVPLHDVYTIIVTSQHKSDIYDVMMIVYLRSRITIYRHSVFKLIACNLSRGPEKSTTLNYNSINDVPQFLRAKYYINLQI